MPELAVREVTVRFGGLLALDGVNLEVPAGAVTGLIGPNGAGKTTLFDVITGLRRPEHGRVLLDGKDITTVAPHQRARKGMARTFQRLELFGSLTARENVQTAAEARHRRGDASPRARADQLLERLGLSEVADTPGDLLPVGLARLLELARALATSPSVVLLDEPSAGLDGEETAALGRVLASLAAEGLGVLLVEHDVDLVMRSCREVVVLDAGAVIARGTPEQIRGDRAVQEAYLGAPPTTASAEAASAAVAASGAGAPAPIAATPNVRGEFPGHPPLRLAAPDDGPGDADPRPALRTLGGGDRRPVLLLAGVRAGYGRIEVLHDVSLSVPTGSITALLGPNGAGKSTLLKVASGRVTPSAGSVRFAGMDTAGMPPERLARLGLCTVPEGRAVFPNLTVAENLRMFGARNKATTIAEMEERSYARFPPLAPRRKQLAGRLSGGEQQMLALARALHGSPRLLLLDELSMGLAPLVVHELYELVATLASEEKVSVLLVEQFAQTALSVAHTAAVLVNGRLVEHGSPLKVSDELVRAYLGGT